MKDLDPDWMYYAFSNLEDAINTAVANARNKALEEAAEICDCNASADGTAKECAQEIRSRISQSA